MLYTLKRLIGLPVRTVGGSALGHVIDFEIEIDEGSLRALLVKPGGLVQGLVGEDLRIEWSRIVEVRQDLVLVEDSVSSVPEVASIRSAMPAGLMMTSEE